jgi:mannose-6-phosphate isomerase-like protein (cupin superfamily)
MNQSSYLGRLKLLPFVTNIEKTTVDNTKFRKILYTTDSLQLVVMCIEPDNEIGEEVHEDTSQFIRIEEGNGILVLEDRRIPITAGDAMVIPSNTYHNVINSSRTEKLHLYSIYSPPHHNFLD